MKQHLLEFLLSNQVSLLFLTLLLVFSFGLWFFEENGVDDLELEFLCQFIQPVIRVTISFAKEVLFQTTPFLQKLLHGSVIQINRDNL